MKIFEVVRDDLQEKNLISDKNPSKINDLKSKELLGGFCFSYKQSKVI